MAVSGSDGRGKCGSVWFRWQRYMQCLAQMAEVHAAVSGSDGRGIRSSAWLRWQRYMQQCLVQMAEVHTAVSGSDGRGKCSSPHPPGVEPSAALVIVSGPFYSAPHFVYCWNFERVFKPVMVK